MSRLKGDKMGFSLRLGKPRKERQNVNRADKSISCLDCWKCQGKQTRKDFLKSRNKISQFIRRRNWSKDWDQNRYSLHHRQSGAMLVGISWCFPLAQLGVTHSSLQYKHIWRGKSPSDSGGRSQMWKMGLAVVKAKRGSIVTNALSHDSQQKKRRSKLWLLCFSHNFWRHCGFSLAKTISGTF